MDQNPILLNLEKVLTDNHIPVIDKSKLVVKTKIQKGGQGSVYKGTLQMSNGGSEFERPVAVKVIEVTYNNLLNTMRELQFLAKGKQLCNTLITIYGITIEQGEEELIKCMIVMELMSSNLQDYIYKVPETQKSMKEKLRILQQIADCLVFLHSHGIVHRDIKPLNILLDEGNNVFVTDLGFSRLMDKGTNIMETQQFSGTVRHASPELFLDNKYNTLSDMWCFGIVAYEMFVMKAPWEGQPFTYRCFLDRKLPFIESWESIIQNEKIQSLIKGCVCYDLQTRLTAGQVKSILVALLWRSSTGTVELT